MAYDKARLLLTTFSAAVRKLSALCTSWLQCYEGDSHVFNRVVKGRGFGVPLAGTGATSVVCVVPGRSARGHGECNEGPATKLQPW